MCFRMLWGLVGSFGNSLLMGMGVIRSVCRPGDQEVQQLPAALVQNSFTRAQLMQDAGGQNEWAANY